MPETATVKIASPHVILCEGKADQAFLRAVRDRRHLPSFDLPFPVFGLPKNDPRLDSIDSFGNMLEKIKDEAALDVTLWSRMRGIVMVADAAEGSDTTIRKIARMSGKAGFGKPGEAGEWSASPTPFFPPVSVLLLPHDAAGGLETLCLRFLRARHAQVAKCLDAYLNCIPPQTRGPEKRDKAALACLIAAIDRDNPTHALSNENSFGGTTPLIDVTDPIFTPFAEALRALLA